MGKQRRQYSTAISDDTLGTYEPGCIYWLKAKNDFTDDGVEEVAELPDGCYDHPAVLLWTENSGARAAIFIVCSSYPSILGCG
jgi:hypothetical protein